ncbi:Lrp/AsnC family transcriptional regulator [Mesorhizobium sp. CGMCC 1.15528]|uniref:Lrp/AsnC family transcriptional regulator n=1 Tax=Mesorhizobium zhangyense TaxID=1776730 RepID=A0A7C9REB0_9HYPH|nr:Lrp/AsnC family transcriptional regulator [Mesorhizobium zhangyense]NGN44573.1 Lrp/AsnC family transcriptional regulator [Mesorhizobium zhangyense]
MTLDTIDRNILANLQADGRITINDLADRVGLSATPCLRRVKRLERDGIIKGYASHVDQVLVGLPVSVFVNVTLQRQAEAELEEFEATVMKYPEVMECYLMTGTSDYLLRIVAADLFAYERFLKSTLTRISGIANIQSSFALKQVVYRTALPIAAHEAKTR